MPTKKHTFVELIAILGLLVWANACHGGREGFPPPPMAPAPAPAPTVTLSAEPNSIQSGGLASLSWTSQNATDLDLQPAIGKVQATGSTSVTLQNSTTYTLTVTGPGGTETATVRISVYPPTTSQPAVEPSNIHVSAIDLFSNSIKDAYFNLDKADIRPDAEQSLTGDANLLKEQPTAKFTIEGQCDDRGSEEYNLALGDRRANAAKSFLVSAGLSADRIDTISYGKNQPVCTDQTEECWQKNRRAHFRYGGESK
jgi:peptidoglycan-associated lipoprotein